jgi:radical SAM superfamily enzyme YgiQ (UPF0313 family)
VSALARASDVEVGSHHVFTIEKSRCTALLEGIVERRLDIPWKCESRADLITPELASLMTAAGCQRVKVGFETGSDRLLARIKKDETRDEMLGGMRLFEGSRSRRTS